MVSCIYSLAVVAMAAVATAVPAGRPCICPLLYAPVCASNSKIYPNICFLRCYNKENNADLKVVHDGRCGNMYPDDNQVEVEAVSADFCPCTKDVIPVCGSDHQTYSNLCELRCAAKKNQSLKMLYDGSCDLPPVNFKLDLPLGPEIPEPDVDDAPDFLLTAKQESADCVCSREYLPVCGSNSHTYANKCLLECDMKKDKSLKMLYPTVCVILP